MRDNKFYKLNKSKFNIVYNTLRKSVKLYKYKYREK